MLKKKKKIKKLAGLWLVGEVVNHVGLYGSKVAEGCSAFQRRSCINIAGLCIGDRCRILLLGYLLTQWRKITVRYCSNLRWQSVFCHSDRWLCCDMHMDRKRPHLTADRPRKTRAMLKSYWHPEFWSSFINKHLSFRQWYTVKSNNKPSHVVILNCHCQIIDIKLHELWMVKYLATFERWSFWGPLFALEKYGI